MTKAKQYKLNFLISRNPNFSPRPYILSDVDAAGYSINSELASFISPGGAIYTQEVIDEIISLELKGGLIGGYAIYSYNEIDTINLFSL